VRRAAAVRAERTSASSTSSTVIELNVDSWTWMWESCHGVVVKVTGFAEARFAPLNGTKGIVDESAIPTLRDTSAAALHPARMLIVRVRARTGARMF